KTTPTSLTPSSFWLSGSPQGRPMSPHYWELPHPPVLQELLPSPLPPSYWEPPRSPQAPSFHPGTVGPCVTSHHGHHGSLATPSIRAGAALAVQHRARSAMEAEAPQAEAPAEGSLAPAAEAQSSPIPAHLSPRPQVCQVETGAQRCGRARARCSPRADPQEPSQAVSQTRWPHTSLPALSSADGTMQAAVPAEKAELVSAAKAMHRDQFGKHVEELFHLEKEAALKALRTGLYVGWRCPEYLWDCFRVGDHSKCFCGHLLNEHQAYKGASVPCAVERCECQSFTFVPSRPEDVGEFRLRRRVPLGHFAWCRCKHSHEKHAPSAGRPCRIAGEAAAPARARVRVRVCMRSCISGTRAQAWLRARRAAVPLSGK
uniref:Family with sequence similarity 221 member B n=1 Tax=Apteryx owenii TaxID=8824 RepID=A0A8B9Q0J8_APTOW